MQLKHLHAAPPAYSIIARLRPSSSCGSVPRALSTRVDMALQPKSSADLGGPCPEPGSQRQGRALQRYSRAQERLIAGCIPLRWNDGESLQHAEVLMISSSAGSNRGLVFPKGGWETDETVAGAAARETMEEAGVRGVLEEPILGAFKFYSKKVPTLQHAPDGRCIAYMFAMRVEEVLPVWPEKAQRNRSWVPILEACSKCRHDWMRDALKVWMIRHGLESPTPVSCQPMNGASEQVLVNTKIAASM